MPYLKMPDWRGVFRSLVETLREDVLDAWQFKWVKQIAVAAGVFVAVNVAHHAAEIPGMASVDRTLERAVTADFNVVEALTKLRSVARLDFSSVQETWARIRNRSREDVQITQVPRPDEFPLGWPVEGGSVKDGQIVGSAVLATFGWRQSAQGENTLHQGMTLDAENGKPVLAAAAGRVVKVSEDEVRGKFVQIDHGNGLSTIYGYLGETMAKFGDSVEKGARIGTTGSSGTGSGPSVYFELQAEAKPIDPAPYLGLVEGGP